MSRYSHGDFDIPLAKGNSKTVTGGVEMTPPRRGETSKRAIGMIARIQHVAKAQGLGHDWSPEASLSQEPVKAPRQAPRLQLRTLQ